MRTVNFSFSTNFFCFSTGSGLIPIISTLPALKVSFSAIASLNWHASLVQMNEPIWGGLLDEAHENVRR